MKKNWYLLFIHICMVLSKFETAMHALLTQLFPLPPPSPQGSATVGNSLLVLLHHNNDCICSGQTLMFECNVIGAGSTVWSGSAFNCPLGEIVLCRTQFTGSTGACSGEVQIVALGISVDDNCYTSWLNVTLSSSVLNHVLIKKRMSSVISSCSMVQLTLLSRRKVLANRYHYS